MRRSRLFEAKKKIRRSKKKAKHHPDVMKMNSARNYKTILFSIGFYEKVISSGHDRYKHLDYPSITTTMSNEWDRKIKVKSIKQLEIIIYKIIELDKEYPDNVLSPNRDPKGNRILDFYRNKNEEIYMDNNDKNIINEYDRFSIIDARREFRSNYGIDITKEFYDFELEDIRDIQYHGKHKGYKMFTYIDNDNNKLKAVCNTLDLDASENHIGGKKDVDLLVEYLEELIDLVIADIKQSGGIYHSAFLDKEIKV